MKPIKYLISNIPFIFCQKYFVIRRDLLGELETGLEGKKVIINRENGGLGFCMGLENGVWVGFLIGLGMAGWRFYVSEYWDL